MIYKVPTMLLEKVSIYTQKFYLFIVASFLLLLLVLFLCLLKIVENCVFILPKGINEFVVFLCIVHVWFWFFTLLLFIIGHKGTTFFPEQKFCFRVHFFFSYKNIASKSFYKSKIHPFPNANAKKWNVIHVYTVRNLINKSNILAVVL
jgi:hypothetical protein